jgi:hypothetical protein
MISKISGNRTVNITGGTFIQYMGKQALLWPVYLTAVINA